MDILDKLEQWLNEDSAQAQRKSAKAKAMGLKHIAYDTYKSADGIQYHWDGKGFIKSNLKYKSAGDQDEERSKELIEKEYGSDAVIRYENYLTKQEGSANKFHYFICLRLNEGGKEEFIGANCYGRIGGTPKFIEIARSEDRSEVRNALDKKIQSKVNKGYKYR